jgi:hypothetical protein
MPDNPIEGFIRDQWDAGIRDTDLVTKRLIEVILLAEDPYTILEPLIAATVTGRFRTFTRALERGAGPLDCDPAQPSDGSQRYGGRAAQDDDDNPDSAPAHPADGSQMRRGRGAQDAVSDTTQRSNGSHIEDGRVADPLAARRKLMTEYVNIPGKKDKVLYADVTPEDAAARLKLIYGPQLRGVEDAIKWWEAAIRAMELFSVGRLGDLPDDALPTGPPPG